MMSDSFILFVEDQCFILFQIIILKVVDVVHFLNYLVSLVIMNEELSQICQQIPPLQMSQQQYGI